MACNQVLNRSGNLHSFSRSLGAVESRESKVESPKSRVESRKYEHNWPSSFDSRWVAQTLPCMSAPHTFSLDRSRGADIRTDVGATRELFRLFDSRLLDS